MPGKGKELPAIGTFDSTVSKCAQMTLNRDFTLSFP